VNRGVASPTCSCALTRRRLLMGPMCIGMGAPCARHDGRARQPAQHLRRQAGPNGRRCSGGSPTRRWKYMPAG
jgi:hypothetical protein